MHRIERERSWRNSVLRSTEDIGVVFVYTLVSLNMRASLSYVGRLRAREQGQPSWAISKVSKLIARFGDRSIEQEIELGLEEFRARRNYIKPVEEE